MKTTIFGITENYDRELQGVQAYAIDGNTGDIIAKHFCSSESFAKSDLGFAEPHDMSVQFSKERHAKYAELYPEGYELVWIGNWHSSETVKELMERESL